MALCNAILVLPCYWLNKTEYGRLAIISEAALILCLVVFFGLFVLDFGGPRRLLYSLRHPTPNSITSAILVIGVVSLLVHLALLGLMHPRQATRRIIAELTIGSAILWSFLILVLLTFVQQIFPGGPLWQNRLMRALNFIVLSCAGGQCLLYCTCRIIDSRSQIKCSRMSLARTRNQAFLFIALFIFLFILFRLESHV